MDTREGEITPLRTIHDVLEALKDAPLERLPGAGIRRSRFTLRKLSEERPLTKVRKKRKYKTRKDSHLRKKRIRSARYRAEALLDCGKCYRYYRGVYGSRWAITEEEWGRIWEEYALQDTSPVVSAIYPGGVLDKYSIVIKPKQEQKLKAAIYDGEDRRLYDIMYNI